jgi:hypothetical protein
MMVFGEWECIRAREISWSELVWLGSYDYGSRWDVEMEVEVEELSSLQREVWHLVVMVGEEG